MAEQEKNIPEKNKIEVKIYGSTYKLVGPESIGHLRLVASIVDDKMQEIKLHNPSLNTTQLAVLTAVNTVHELLKLKEEVERLEEELKKLKG
ncbi:MAG: cell division protein ZapA [Bacilli bacterium]|uniref:Cell division protein ZapA n=1 Tax=Ureibacillus suwonensis TaxID=313007 RepID=A0ABW0RCS2_9BACL